MTISIIDLVGEIVQEQKLKWNNDVAVNIRSLKAGIYFLSNQIRKWKCCEEVCEAINSVVQNL